MLCTCVSQVVIHCLGGMSKSCLINCPQSRIACEQNHWNMTFKVDLCWHFHYISTTLDAFWRARYESGERNNPRKGVSTSLPSIILHHSKDNKSLERYISTHLFHNQFSILCPFYIWYLMLTDGCIGFFPDHSQNVYYPGLRWVSI